MGERLFTDNSDFLRRQADEGICGQIDPELFFPDSGRSADAEKACGTCDIEIDCRDFGVKNPEMLGIWGGWAQSKRERENKRLFG